MINSINKQSCKIFINNNELVASIFVHELLIPYIGN